MLKVHIALTAFHKHTDAGFWARIEGNLPVVPHHFDQLRISGRAYTVDYSTFLLTTDTILIRLNSRYFGKDELFQYEGLRAELNERGWTVNDCTEDLPNVDHLAPP